MFNFTSQTIVNTLTGRADLNLTDSVRVDNLILKKGDVISIEKKLPQEEVLAKVTINLAALDSAMAEGVTKATGRIALYIGLAQTSNDSFYANDMVYKGKPIYIEFPYTKNESTKAPAKLKKIAEQILTMDGAPILTVSNNGAVVTFTAVNGYQIIRSAELQIYDPAISAIDCCSNEGGFKTVSEAIPVYAEDMFEVSGNLLVANDSADWEPADSDDSIDSDDDIIYPGSEAFCDYAWIMHNLRIPTCANTNYWSITKKAGELPVANGKYVQYIFKVRTERVGIGGGVVGEVN